MKSHNGMRPQDIVVLLKIQIARGDWQYRDLAASLDLSISEISDSLVRSHSAGLIDAGKRKVFARSLGEFITYGLPYVFPQAPGSMVTGIATAHSHPFFSPKFISDIPYVWAYGEGDTRGLSIQPLYKGAPKAALADEKLYLLLAAIDMLRVGKTREKKMAIDLILKKIKV